MLRGSPVSMIRPTSTARPTTHGQGDEGTPDSTRSAPGASRPSSVDRVRVAGPTPKTAQLILRMARTMTGIRAIPWMMPRCTIWPIITPL